MRRCAFYGSCLVLLALTSSGYWMRDRLEPWVTAMVYPSLWVTFVLLGAALWECGVRNAECGTGKEDGDKRQGESGKSKVWRDWFWAVGTGLALTSLCYLSVEPAFRVLSDETNQLDASLSLYLDRTLKLITQGQYYYSGFHTILTEPTHRGGLFPFCICLCHSLFGYSGNHGFLVNFFASTLTLAAVVRFGQKVLGLACGVIAAVLLASFPLYALVATSSAFEMMNLLLITLVFFQLHRFLEKPDGPELEGLLLLAVLASQCRYETTLLFLPVAAAWYWKRKALVSARLSWRLAVIPLLFLPVIWQRVAMGSNGLGTIPGDAAFFSVAYLWRNVLHALEVFVNPAWRDYPTSPLVFALFLAGGALLVKDWLSEKSSARVHPGFVGLVAMGLVGIAGAQLLYSWGDFRHPAAIRFASVYLPAMCLVAAYPLYRLWEKPGMAAPLSVLLVGLLAHGLATASKNDHGNTLTLFREYKRNLEFLKPYPKDGMLIIADRPGMYVAHEYGAVNSSYANKNADKVLESLKRHLYTEVLVIQHVLYKTRQAAPALNPKFVLTPVFEYQNGGEDFVRISRVVAPSEGALPATAQPSSSGSGTKIRLSSPKNVLIQPSSQASMGSRTVGLTTETGSRKVPETPESKKAREEYVEAQKRYMDALKKAMEKTTSAGQDTGAGKQK